MVVVNHDDEKNDSKSHFYGILHFNVKSNDKNFIIIVVNNHDALLGIILLHSDESETECDDHLFSFIFMLSLRLMWHWSLYY